MRTHLLLLLVGCGATEESPPPTLGPQAGEAVPIAENTTPTEPMEETAMGEQGEIPLAGDGVHTRIVFEGCGDAEIDNFLAALSNN